MAKKIFSAVILMLVLVLAIGVFAGCESYSNTNEFAMDDANAATLSNGGSVLLHGDYVYFINGYSDYLKGFKENWFGNVLKGSVMRIKKDSVDMSTAEVIVPKSVISDSDNAGISIYGEYIYYVSSGTDENKAGEVVTSTLQFFRTRLDGTDTKLILELEDGLATEYKYTPSGLLYILDDDVYFKSTTGRIKKASNKGTIVAEDVSSAFLPRDLYYNPAEGAGVSDYFFYTKASEVTGVYTNELYVSSADGNNSKKLIDSKTYTDDPVNDSKNAFSIALVASKDEGDSLTLLYKKSYYVGTSSTATVKGMFMYNFNTTDFDFDKSKEVQISNAELKALKIISYNEGALCTDENLSYYSYDFQAGKTAVPVVFSSTETGSKISGATVVGIDNGYIYYYDADVKIYRYKLDGSSNVEHLGTAKISADFLKPELVIDGDKTYIYYFNDDASDYLYRLDATSFDRKEGTADDILMGRKTDADIAAEAEKEEE